MKEFITAALPLCAVFTCLEPSYAYTNYPWCIISNNRGMDCVFSSYEQCQADGRNRGFGSNCRQNPAYNPKLPSVVEGGAVRRPRPAPWGGRGAKKFTLRVLVGGVLACLLIGAWTGSVWLVALRKESGDRPVSGGYRGLRHCVILISPTKLRSERRAWRMSMSNHARRVALRGSYRRLCRRRPCGPCARHIQNAQREAIDWAKANGHAPFVAPSST